MEYTITHNNIAFVDAQAMSMNYSKTFEAPNKEDLDSIKIGDFVKICVNDERFWVKVTDIKDDVITGQVDNDLVLNDKIKYNDTIDFPKKCIFAITE